MLMLRCQTATPAAVDATTTRPHTHIRSATSHAATTAVAIDIDIIYIPYIAIAVTTTIAIAITAQPLLPAGDMCLLRFIAPRVFGLARGRSQRVPGAGHARRAAPTPAAAERAPGIIGRKRSDGLRFVGQGGVEGRPLRGVQTAGEPGRSAVLGMRSEFALCQARGIRSVGGGM